MMLPKTERLRSPPQEDADKIDLALFNAIRAAEDYGTHSRNWRNIAAALRSARAHVRLEMHPDDRERAAW